MSLSQKKLTIVESTISLNVDRTSIDKGDIVNVTRPRDLPDSLVLSIDDGDSVQNIKVTN